MKICVIYPHPDDAALNAAGTLARWVEEGHEITSICCTRGNVGTLRLDQSKDQVATLRSQELLEANEILGIPESLFLDFPDGCMMDPEKLREALVRCIRRYRPERVLTMDPWARYEVHRDHITVGQMASEAAAFACFPLLYPEHLQEGLTPHSAGELWYMGALGKPPNTFVNIVDQLPKKTAALLKFEVSLAILDQLFAAESGEGSSMEELRSRADQWITGGAAELGAAVNLAAAEAFVVQKCAPGHLVNMEEINREMLGLPALPPTVIR